MEIFIKENGRITWLMEMDALLIHKEEPQMDIGSTIYKMDLARRLGRTEPSSSRASTFRAKSAVEDAMSGLTEAFMKETSKIACSTVTAFTISLSQRKPTKVSSRKISSTGKAS